MLAPFQPMPKASIISYPAMRPFQCQMKLDEIAGQFTVNEGSIIWMWDRAFIIFT